MVLDRQFLLLGTDILLLWCQSPFRCLILVYLFINMFALIVLYTGLFFYVRMRARGFRKYTSSSDHVGILETGGSGSAKDSQILVTRTVSVTSRPLNHCQKRNGDSVHGRMNTVSYTLLLYPTVFIILTMPVAVARLYEFVGRPVTLKSLYIGAAMFDLQGFANVILYTATRKGIIPWNRMFEKFPKFTLNRNCFHNLSSPRRVVPKSSAISIATSNGPPSDKFSVGYESETEIHLCGRVFPNDKSKVLIINDRLVM